jgi:hypothetical protein
MFGSPHPGRVGLSFDESSVHVAGWDGLTLSVASTSHDGSPLGAVSAARRMIESIQPRRPYNLIASFALPVAEPGRLATQLGAGAATFRIFQPDGTQAQLDRSAALPVAGAVPGVLGAVEWVWQSNEPRIVVVERTGADRIVARSRPIEPRRPDHAWCDPPVETTVETWYGLTDGDPDLRDALVLVCGDSAEASAAWAVAHNAARVVVPEHAAAWRAVGLILADPVIDFSMEIETAEAPVDLPTLRRHFADLMERAAAGVQQACYEQDDAALYRHAVVDPHGTKPEVLSMEAASDFEQLTCRRRMTLRLTTRAVIAVVKPSVACLTYREGG